MSTRVLASVHCDAVDLYNPNGCPAELGPYDIEAHSSSEARREAKKHGWVRRGGMDLCPGHAACCCDPIDHYECPQCPEHGGGQHDHQRYCPAHRGGRA